MLASLGGHLLSQPSPNSFWTFRMLPFSRVSSSMAYMGWVMVCVDDTILVARYCFSIYVNSIFV